MTAYAELHCHTNFSFLDGASWPAELAERAVELGYDFLAERAGAIAFHAGVSTDVRRRPQWIIDDRVLGEQLCNKLQVRVVLSLDVSLYLGCSSLDGLVRQRCARKAIIDGLGACGPG